MSPQAGAIQHQEFRSPPKPKIAASAITRHTFVGWRRTGMAATTSNMNADCEEGRMELQDQLASTPKSNGSNTRAIYANVGSSHESPTFSTAIALGRARAFILHIIDRTTCTARTSQG